MARSLHLWQDARGYLHPTEQTADDADRLFAENSERESRRAIVRTMLVERIRRHDGHRLLGRNVPSIDAADWLIANWPALKAIGYAYRLDDLGGSGEMVLPTTDRTRVA